MTNDDSVADDGGRDDGEEIRDRAGSEGRVTLGDQDVVLWAAAVVSGAVAYLLGYLVTLAVQLITAKETVIEQSVIDQLGRSGVIYSAAHSVDVISDTPLVVVRGNKQYGLGQQFDFFRLADLLDTSLVLPEIVFLGLPVVAIGAVALGRAWYVSGSETDSSTILTSIGMSLGYGGAAYLGSLVFSYQALEVYVVDNLGYIGRDVLRFPPNVTKSEISQRILIFSIDSTGILFRAVAYSLVVAVVASGIAVVTRNRLRE